MLAFVYIFFFKCFIFLMGCGWLRVVHYVNVLWGEFDTALIRR